jgi:hypothetical protein
MEENDTITTIAIYETIHVKDLIHSHVQWDDMIHLFCNNHNIIKLAKNLVNYAQNITH